jgi:hypothetical protein
MEIVWKDDKKTVLILGFVIDFQWIRELLCWHQWYDSQIGHIRDFKVEEQWCIHCGKWRRKQRAGNNRQ